MSEFRQIDDSSSAHAMWRGELVGLVDPTSNLYTSRASREGNPKHGDRARPRVAPPCLAGGRTRPLARSTYGSFRVYQTSRPARNANLHESKTAAQQHKYSRNKRARRAHPFAPSDEPSGVFLWFFP